MALLCAHRLVDVQAQATTTFRQCGRPQKGSTSGVARSLHSFDCGVRCFRAPGEHRLYMGRMESGSRRFPDSRSVTRGGASTLYLLHQFALSLPRSTTVFLKMQCSRLVAPRNPYLRRMVS